MIKKVIKIHLDNDTRMIVIFQREKKQILNFVVVLEARGKIVNIGKDEWIQVLRIDTAHGYPHMDKLDKEGNKIDIVKFDYLNNEEALTLAIDLLKKNYKEFIKSFIA